MNKINQVRRPLTQAGATIQMLAYIVSTKGEPLAGSPAVQSIQLVEEFGQYRVRYLPATGMDIHEIKGADGSEPLWSPGIDGQEGFNSTLDFDGKSLTFIEDPNDPGSGIPPSEPSLRGNYRIVVRFTTGTVQEYSLSVRE